jgi:hypothetical protein
MWAEQIKSYKCYNGNTIVIYTFVIFFVGRKILRDFVSLDLGGHVAAYHNVHFYSEKKRTSSEHNFS